MISATVRSIPSGLEVIDIEEYPAFSARPARPRNPTSQIVFSDRLAQALLQSPDTILQWLVDSALEACGADSAGISVEQYAACDEGLDPDMNTIGYQWVATAGQYGPLQDAVIPRKQSACDICLNRGRPQLYRISRRFLHSLGVDAAQSTDGLMVPWEAEGLRGTVWILAHGRTEAFDQGHLDTLMMLSRFAALSAAQRERRKQQDRQWAITTASAVIKVLALRIREPLEDLANLVFVARNGKWEGSAESLARQLDLPLSELSELVEQSLGSSVRSRPN